MVKVYRCKICGEGYIGDSVPTHCPFCGAHVKSMVLATAWSWPDVNVTDVSKKNLERALQLEISNSEFYFCAAKKANNEADRTMFKRLAKIEREHADLISKHLKIKGSEISQEKDICSMNNTDNLRESNTRERNAIGHYAKFLTEAKEERIKEIFTALIEVENDHLSLTEGRF